MSSPVFLPADILLPPQGTDLGRWAVLACDQFTSQPEYWRQAEELVGGNPSTLRIILPELLLGQEGAEQRIQAIHQTMYAYRETLLRRRVSGFVYVERQLPSGVRQGLVGCVDLEEYSHAPNAAPRVRPTEETVEARIPPRLAVRRGAVLESPHILMLCDDADKTVIEPIAAKKERLAPLYTQRLMLGGGEVQGWAVTQEEDIGAVQAALAALEEETSFRRRYGDAGCTPFSLAVGDGNHSLAAAKAAWEEKKAALPHGQRQAHPARFCLVELENIQSDAIVLEAIHRVAFGIGEEELWQAVRRYRDQNGIFLREEKSKKCQNITLVYGGRRRHTLALENPKEPLAAGTVDEILRFCAEGRPGLSVDYVHGEEAAVQLAQGQAVGFLLPPLQKSDIFRGVAQGGVLPRKTFSLGKATEKRYYMECRAL